ncbi:MAG: hypothetical protein AUK43_07420 [Oscillatoriales cyanobacterium CG2_30_40_61]|nr:MAG: hypothetical protein AUK43_07420 [Oscillatoriales cyanobacterium CG2_30_40_61]
MLGGTKLIKPPSSSCNIGANWELVISWVAIAQNNQRLKADVVVLISRYIPRGGATQFSHL